MSPCNCHARDCQHRALRARFVARPLAVDRIQTCCHPTLSDGLEQARRSPGNARASKRWIRDASFRAPATISRHLGSRFQRARREFVFRTVMSPREPWVAKASRAAAGSPPCWTQPQLANEAWRKIWMPQTRFSWDGDGSVNGHHHHSEPPAFLPPTEFSRFPTKPALPEVQEEGCESAGPSVQSVAVTTGRSPPVLTAREGRGRSGDTGASCLGRPLATFHSFVLLLVPGAVRLGAGPISSRKSRCCSRVRAFPFGDLGHVRSEVLRGQAPLPPIMRCNPAKDGAFGLSFHPALCDQFQGGDVGHIEAIVLHCEPQGLTQEFVLLAHCRF